MQKVYIEILNVLKARENFDFVAYKLPMLIRRINNRIIQTHQETPEKYIEYLISNKMESKELLNNFLINVSHFFRDPLLFEFLKAHIVPELVKQFNNTGQNTFRIWSAGCSRGEEAYSLAILLHEYFNKEAKKININFFATDYDDAALLAANKGQYLSASLDETKSKYLNKYFTKSDGIYHLDSSIKSMVRFSKYNLIDKNSYIPSESIFGNFDMVLCRNVLIYFNQTYQEIIFDKLYKSLSPNRILILGEAEAPTMNFKMKFERINSCCRIYQKK
jgi:chemotaxis methyl-accepting protein methylase